MVSKLDVVYHIATFAAATCILSTGVLLTFVDVFQYKVIGAFTM